jgi:hypothetical protein
VISKYKPNVMTGGGPHLDNNFECFTIGFHAEGGQRTMEHFNFKASESRSNVVVANAVMSKYKHSGDTKPVNVYQKPRELLNWMVGHFSRPKEWVMDLLSGSGTGLASCMAYGRHCVAIEVDARQAMVLKERVLQLVDKEDENLLDVVVLGETGSQPLLTLESQEERGESSRQAADRSSQGEGGSSQREEE